MNLSENYKSRLKSLSGIKLDEIQLKAVSGRSEKGTLSYFVEEYILEIGESFINRIESESKKIPKTVFLLEQGSVNISKNLLLINFSLVDESNQNDVKKTNFSLSISVNLESSSNTVAILRYGTLNDEFNLQSKHSPKDVSDLIDEIVTRALNVKRSQN
jgi:hypothetical protein